jgi:hypothetical protein
VLTSIWRHPGDKTLWRLLDREFRPIAACQIGAEMNPYNRRGWRVSCHAASRSVPESCGANIGSDTGGVAR